MTLPANWQTGQSFTAAAENAVESAINSSMQVVGSYSNPMSNASTARPTGAVSVYWICAHGVWPANVIIGDLVYYNGQLTVYSQQSASAALTGKGKVAGTAGLPPISSLQDAFSASNTTLWTYGAGNSVSGGALNLVMADGSLCYTNYRYNFVGSTVFAKINPSTAGTASTGAAFYMLVSPDTPADVGTNSFGLQIYQSGVQLMRYIGGTLTTAAGPTYNATNHLWLRLRELSGTGYLDAAPDGSTWTNIVSYSYSTLNLSNVALMFQAYQSGGSTSATVQDLNI